MDAREQAEKAIELVWGDRNEDYGHPYDDYSRTVDIFRAMTGHELTPYEGTIFMLCVKLSRQMNKPKDDNMVDAHGYLICMERTRERQDA